ncbi:ABC transporter substrate-binding protein [Sediminicoccus sp. KRV36]|uniref:ABC transporter substrate-binding protein n=1 Tax=Sediminicoccus sp. KRV36 TaxID=3133721 RepID=UPI00200EA9D3|nr:ABC transporter substrate-binding protein [Sediminicoccus rosea]UPY38763.1 ABC transporter substrate-binding protein [Sediminicoccus rosea]
MTHDPNTLSRRSALGLLAAPAVLSAPVHSQSLRRVSFTLPWVPEGPNLIAYVARANNFWAEEGLDVEVSRGTGSTAAAQAIAAGRFDYGMAAASAGLQMAARGLPIVQVASISYDVMMALVVRADGPIRQPSDLNGKRLASVATSGDYPFLQPFAAASGIDLARVEASTVDNNVRQRVLVEGQVDAITGFATSIVPVYTSQGFNTRSFLFSAAGLSFYGNTIMTQRARLTSEPQVARGIVTGLMKAQKFMLLNPDEALRIFARQVPESALSRTAQQQARVGLGMARLAALPERVWNEPVGFSEPAEFTRMLDLTMRYLATPGDTRPALEAVVTNELLGGVTMTRAEWQRAAELASEFRPLVG